MSATISTSPSPAATIPQAALTGTGESGISLAAPDTDDAGQFTALFRQLLSEQSAIDAMAQPGLLPADILVAAESAEAGDALAALLPFIDALGLAQYTGVAAQSDAVEEIPAKDDSAASPLAGLAAALTPPSATDAAISAANATSRDSGKNPPTVLASLSERASIAPNTDNANASGRGSAATGEFSSQLATALSTTGDKAAIPSGSNMASLQFSQPGTAPMPTLPVTLPVGAPAWGEEVGNRIAWMAGRMESRAELVLTPPHMGRVGVSLTVSGDQASAIFTSANPAVREALEAAMPRLRELLADAGIQLGQAQVGAENARQFAQQEKNGDNFDNRRGTDSAAGLFQTGTDMPLTPSDLKMGRGLVDVFA